MWVLNEIKVFVADSATFGVSEQDRLSFLSEMLVVVKQYVPENATEAEYKHALCSWVEMTARLKGGLTAGERHLLNEL